MAAIRRFFEKKKMEVKFKLAGEGHRLTETAQNTAVSRSSHTEERHVPKRDVLSSEAQMAASAALARLDKKDDIPYKRSIAVIKAQAKKELELEQQQANKSEAPSTSVSAKPCPAENSLAVEGVFFKCPLVGPDVLPKAEIDAKIKAFLYEHLPEEPGLTACLIIHTINKDKEKVQQGVETLYKYLDNVIQNPSQEKYRRIRIGNRVYQDRVAPLQGVDEFLVAAGFVPQSLPISAEDSSVENFWVFESTSKESLLDLAALRDSLVAAEPLKAELDRNLQVLVPSQAATRTNLPQEFFRLSAEELKKEQQARSELLERNLMLRTKAMRDKDEQREQRKYKFTLIRVKFPDGTLLQGTFHVQENLAAVKQFIQDNLEEPSCPFNLTVAGTMLDTRAESCTLLSLHLAPTAGLHFSSLKGNIDGKNFLKDEILALIQTLQ